MQKRVVCVCMPINVMSKMNHRQSNRAVTHSQYSKSTKKSITQHRGAHDLIDKILHLLASKKNLLPTKEKARVQCISPQHFVHLKVSCCALFFLMAGARARLARDEPPGSQYCASREGHALAAHEITFARAWLCIYRYALEKLALVRRYDFFERFMRTDLFCPWRCGDFCYSSMKGVQMPVTSTIVIYTLCILKTNMHF